MYGHRTYGGDLLVDQRWVWSEDERDGWGAQTLADDAGITVARKEFERTGCVAVSRLIPARLRSAVASEALRLVEHMGVRRDLVLAATGYTPRRMRNVTRADIACDGSVIEAIYDSATATQLLSAVAGEPVFRCPYEPEQFVITRLEQAGDTHGWHWDDYSFALVWVAECPPTDEGGFVECIPDTVWDKAKPEVNRLVRDRVVHKSSVGAGDVYLMRANTTLHRVYPIRRGRRTIVNMAFASAGELNAAVSHETMDILW
ncbi:HalD/BesD family halogenase [Nocardia anaemiae]|uniref:HalD/BesD family halogenase n=1 Tax=Nocardia anaemiae TaxID=263910 RepID=UPI003FCC462F